jgi:hypothetical protein
MLRRLVVAPALALLLAGCGEEPTGPKGGMLLVGRFGNPDLHAELVAIRAGAELNLPCGEYFSAAEPIVLGALQTFRVDGRWSPVDFGGPGTPRDAELRGAYVDGVLTVTLSVAGHQTYTLALQHDVDGEVDAVLCASKRGA